MTMAEVLKDHQYFHGRKNLGYYRTEYVCECGAVFWAGEHHGDPSLSDVIAEHQEEVLAAAGFGKVSD